MISLDQLVSTYNGKQVEVAGSTNAKFQCVDLVNLYIRDCLGFSIIEHTDAKDFPSKAGTNFDVITHMPIPQRGDIGVMSGAVGGGHGDVFIVLSATSTQITTFGQNWITPLRCSIQIRSYSNVVCFLRPKSTTIPEMDKYAKDQQFMPGMVDENNNPIEVQRARSLITDQQNAIISKNKEIQSLKEQLSNFQEQPHDEELEAKVERLRKANEEVMDAETDLGV